MFKKMLGACVIGLCIVVSTHSALAQDATAAGTYNEGLALLKSKDYENGLVKMEEALALAEADENEQIIGLAKKNGAVAAYNLGNTKRKAGDHEGAIALYNKGIGMNPSYSSNYEGIGRSQEAQGEKLEAVKSFVMAAQKATEEGKEDRAKSRYKKAQVLIGKTYVGKDYDTALAMAQAFNESGEANPEVYYYMSRALGAQSNYGEAIPAMRKAVELKGDSVPDKYTFYLAEQLEKTGANAEAAALYKTITDEKYKKQAVYRAGELEK